MSVALRPHAHSPVASPYYYDCPGPHQATPIHKTDDRVGSSSEVSPQWWPQKFQWPVHLAFVTSGRWLHILNVQVGTALYPTSGPWALALVSRLVALPLVISPWVFCP